MKWNFRNLLRIAAVVLTLTPAVLISQDDVAPGDPQLQGVVESGRVTNGYLRPMLSSDPIVQPSESATPAQIGTSQPCAGQNYFETQPQRHNWLRGGENTNTIVGATGLIMTRDYADSVLLSNAATGTLATIDADLGDLGGVDTYLIRRNDCGKGWEARYFTLLSSDDTRLLTNGTTTLTQLAGLSAGGTDLQTIYDTAPNVHSLTRNMELNNFEFNFLGQNRQPNSRASMRERILGFRYFGFNENLQYNATQTAAVPNPAAGYNVSTENHLFGFQLGQRGEYQLFGRTSLSLSAKLGVFNNRARSRHQATFVDGTGTAQTVTINAGAAAGSTFDFGDQKDELSFLGELDAGLIFSVNRNTRMRVGYRALGVTDLALPEQQLISDFTNTTALQTTLTDNDISFDGGYFGIEFAY